MYYSGYFSNQGDFEGPWPTRHQTLEAINIHRPTRHQKKQVVFKDTPRDRPTRH
jgi:hypothetical protein